MRIKEINNELYYWDQFQKKWLEFIGSKAEKLYHETEELVHKEREEDED